MDSDAAHSDAVPSDAIQADAVHSNSDAVQPDAVHPDAARSEGSQNGASSTDDEKPSKASFFSRLASYPIFSSRIFWIAVGGSLLAIVVGVVCWATLVKPDKHGAQEVAPANSPNIVVILTDDQDMHMDSLSHMPLLTKHMREQGTEFQRHYCTVSICCPARVTIWTGQHAHNHGVTDVVGHWGGWPRFKQRNLNGNYLPVWLQTAGYNTYYAGKLFNALAESNYKDPYPGGWTGSDFLLDPNTYMYKYPRFQRNVPDPTNPSKTVHYPVESPAAGGKDVYSTTLVHQKGYGFLQNAVQARQSTGKPFFLTIAPIAPHADYRDGAFQTPIAETQADLDMFNETQVPRVDWFNPDQPSGVSWMYQLQQLDQGNVSYMDQFYRARLAALQSVDRMVANITTEIENLGISNNTYIIYTTDNGYHVGQHRLQPGKNCPFETDVNIPLIIRGPGVAKNVTSYAVSSHTDIAPTIFDMIGRTVDPGFDGKVIQYKNGTLPNGSGNMPKTGDHVNVEFWGDWRPEGEIGQDRKTKAMANFTKYGQSATYKALRVIGDGYDLYYSMWCSPTSSAGYENELYDMTTDPYQLSNLIRHPNGTLLSINSTYLANLSVTATGMTTSVPKLWKRLDALMFVLKTCKADTCRDPWNALLPNKGVVTLNDALNYNESFFDEMREKGKTVAFQLTGTGNECIEGPVLSTADGTTMWKGELPVFQGAKSLFERDGISWEEWT